MEQSADMRRIFTAMNLIDGLYNVGAKWNGVKTNTLYLLYAVGDGEPHTQKSICDDWLIPRTTLNTIVKECKADGYVTLEPVPGRKRDLYIRLTEQGKAFADEVLAPICEAEQKAIDKMTQERGLDFIADLERFSLYLREAFEGVTENEKP